MVESLPNTPLYLHLLDRLPSSAICAVLCLSVMEGEDLSVPVVAVGLHPGIDVVVPADELCRGEQ